jgi:hypothetical protein
MKLEKELLSLVALDAEAEQPLPHATWSPMPFGRPEAEPVARDQAQNDDQEDEPLEFLLAG